MASQHLWTFERVPVNKELLTGTVPVNKKLLTGSVPVNNLFLKGTVSGGDLEKIDKHTVKYDFPLNVKRQAQ